MYTYFIFLHFSKNAKFEDEHIENMDLNSQERKDAIKIITLEGDFLHKCAVMLEQVLGPSWLRPGSVR